MYLSLLSVEDVEDFYIIEFMVTGFLSFGAGGFMMYRILQELQDLNLGICRAVSIKTHAIHERDHGLDALAGKVAAVSELVREVGSNMEKLSAQVGGNDP